MSKIFVSHNNIISSLGFDSKAVVDKISDNVSGLKLIEDNNKYFAPFYSSIIDQLQLQKEFNKLDATKNYTHLEKMMITSLSKVIKASNIKMSDRVGLIISTTKGNIDILEKNSLFDKKRAYLCELAKEIKEFFRFKTEPIVLSNACVSGLLAIVAAKRFISQGVYDEVLVVGGDIVSEFTLSGFSSFQALSNKSCMPYDQKRNGINIGEVASCALVTKNKLNLVSEAVEVIGEGSCNDANHISGPSRTGEGLYRSVKKAMSQAKVSPSKIDYISAHGTATMYNDEMEAIAFSRLDLHQVPLNSLKGYFGHTLGASGLVETIIGMHSLNRNELFNSLGTHKVGVNAPINVILKKTKAKLETFLKTSSGFGGCNAAVIFKKIKQ